MGEERKIKWSSRERINFLEPYIKDILAVIADELGNPGINQAWCTDKSHLFDFVNDLEKDHTPNYINIIQKLGIDIELKEAYIWKMAQKLAHGD